MFQCQKFQPARIGFVAEHLENWCARLESRQTGHTGRDGAQFDDA